MRGAKRRLPSGAWELSVSLGRDLVTGTYPRLSETFHLTARQADEALRKRLIQRTPDAGGAGATLGRLFDAWLVECDIADSRSRSAVSWSRIPHSAAPA